MRRPVVDMDIEGVKSFNDLLRQYVDAGGFMASKVGEAIELLDEMVGNDDYKVFMSFPADVIATGLRGVITTMVKRGWVDVLITTCGSIDHDLARCFGKYYRGDFYLDDRELKRRRLHRLGNILVPYENYGLLIEEKMREFLEEYYGDGVREPSTYELNWYIGSKLDESSFLYWAYKNKIPVIVPGPYDGAVGSQIWFFQQRYRDFRLDLYKDEVLVSDIVFEAKKTGGIILGGGISKHHLLWWNQFRGGLDLVIQITTGVEFDGSLTGARLSEAITWGKVKPEGREVSIWGEATVIFPILIKALLERY
jgi:deoxyhypusine synthase